MGRMSQTALLFTDASSITTNATTQTKSSAIYVGVAGNYEFYVNGAWVHFKAVPAGTVLNIEATGARDQSDGSACAAGEIVFLR
tara:strand:+ start:680 stop:931 length:252 start_codon:yes stop_codon:yes gene_type:complete